MAPLRVFVVDDNDLARHLVRRLVESQGLQVCAEAKDGREAVQMVGAVQPDLIILDLLMPEMNGLEAAREILKLRPSVPIVINTFYASEQVLVEAQKVGVRHVVSKSNHQSLVAAVNALLRKEGLAPGDDIPNAN